MRTLRWRLPRTTLGLAAAFGCVLAGSVFASAGASAPGAAIGYVYVNDNTAGVNTIAGFARQANGTLTPLAQSPFAAGGAGTGTGIASQGALQLSADGRYVLAVDAGSNQISVLQIEAGGALQLVGAPVSSNGVDPVSIAVHDSLVYVANAGASASNYTGFTLNAGGQLQPLAGSTVALPNGSQPGDVLFDGDGSKLVGTRVGSSLIDSFTVASSGLLSAAPGSPFAAQGFGPFGSEFRPTDPAQLFVTNAHTAAGGPAPGSVSAFSDAADGALTPVAGSPFTNDGIASCWVEISHDGAYLFTVNTASATISSYTIAPDGTLSFLASAPMKGSVHGPEDARLSPDGTTLFVVDAGVDELSSFAVTGGSLGELAQSPVPLPGGAAPAGIVVTETNLQGSNLQGARLEGADLPDANLEGANLRGADLEGANLQDAALEGANLQGVNATGASLLDAQLQGSNLQQGTYANANLGGANLEGANLQGANLTGATLANADLDGANLQNANLTGASLAGATATAANLQGIIWSNTTCPDGTNSNADGGTCQHDL
jgi:6-phosphogluconolactonase